MHGCLPVVYVFHILSFVCVRGFNVCNTTVCGKRLVNGAMTSGVTSLITSVTFSQMSFLCD